MIANISKITVMANSQFRLSELGKHYAVVIQSHRKLKLKGKRLKEG